jgi:phospholipase/carboxylesterase
MGLSFDTPPVVVEPAGETQAAVLWLHGLGASGDDFPPALPLLQLPPDHGIAFHFPHAPIRPVTLNNGYAMRAWYDLYGLDFSTPPDQKGIHASVAYVHDWLREQETLGLMRERLFIAGFSQGGAIALQAGLAESHLCGGIIALSTYLPLPDEVVASNTPIFLAHGLYDDVIPLHVAERAFDQLQHRHPNPEHIHWETWPMAHTITPEEFQTLGQWLTARLR